MRIFVQAVDLPGEKVMGKEHVLSDEVFTAAQFELSYGKNWVAFNEGIYFLEKEYVHFFKEKIKAHEFARNNLDEGGNYKVVYACSADELLKRIYYGEKLQQILSNKLFTMNEKNYDYLANQLKYTGFGEALQHQLQEKMKLGEPNFTLNFKKSFGKDEVTATLHFKKSDESDMYFFNRYSMTLKNERFPEPLTRAFYINPKEETITMKEAYNLLSGRAVHKELANKEGEKYKAWLQIDFKETDISGTYKMKQYHQNYGYDMSSVLASYPIKELQSEQEKQKLIDSLQRGNRQSVTMDLGGKESKMFIEASPQFKNMNLFDAGMKRLTKMSLTEMKDNTQGQAMKVAQKQSDVDDGAGEQPKKKGRKRGQKTS
jgi:hypothetical protein